MTLAEYASLFNITGIAIVLAISVVVMNRHPAPYFRAWTAAYGCNFLLLSLEFYAHLTGRPIALALVEIGVCITGAWFFLNAGSLLGGHRLPARLYWLMLVVFELGSAILLARGVPAPAVGMVPLLLLTLGYVWIGLKMLRRGSGGNLYRPWLGWPLIFNGLLPLSYPVLSTTSHHWVGFWLAGSMHLLVGIGMVVTLLEESAQELRRNNLALEEADRVRRNFFNTVSHEVRTPISAIVGFLEFLEERIGGPLTAQQDSYVRQMQEAAKQLQGLFDSILDSARIDAGTFEIRLESVQVAQTIDQAIGPLKPALERKGLKVCVDAPADLTPAVADPNRLVQIFNNLLSNAIKFTPAGGTIRIEASRAADALEIRVADNGHGIPEDKLGSIFEPFFQVDGSHTREHGGAGLGLSIVSRLVHLMHGEIRVESRLGEGSTFTVTLPAYRPRVSGPLPPVQPA